VTWLLLMEGGEAAVLLLQMLPELAVLPLPLLLQNAQPMVAPPLAVGCRVLPALLPGLLLLPPLQPAPCWVLLLLQQPRRQLRHGRCQLLTSSLLPPLLLPVHL
jgi:hypothetical protein